MLDEDASVAVHAFPIEPSNSVLINLSRNRPCCLPGRAPAVRLLSLPWLNHGWNLRWKVFAVPLIYRKTGSVPSSARRSGQLNSTSHPASALFQHMWRKSDLSASTSRKPTRRIGDVHSSSTATRRRCRQRQRRGQGPESLAYTQVAPALAHHRRRGDPNRTTVCLKRCSVSRRARPASPALQCSLAPRLFHEGEGIASCRKWPEQSRSMRLPQRMVS